MSRTTFMERFKSLVRYRKSLLIVPLTSLDFFGGCVPPTQDQFHRTYKSAYQGRFTNRIKCARA